MKFRYILLTLSAILAFVSCSDEDKFVPGTGGNQSERYMKIQMNLPEFKTPTTGGGSTRAMSPIAEKTIDPNNFSVLVFEYNESGGNVTETYSYSAPLSGEFVVDADNPSIAEITVKLVKSESNSEKFRIAIVANHDITGISMIKGQTSKEDIYESLVYSVSGKWNANDTNPTLFPMWGETQPVVVTEDIATQQISLYRALARIDVGLGFTAVDGKLTEVAEGLSNFALKEIKVYRTYNKGAVAPLEEDYKATPTIPSIAELNEEPLEYSFQYGVGSSFTREIYVPEANVPVSPSNDNMHCLVIGGYYKGETEVTYYRLDFAKRINTTEPIPTNDREYFHIMRNHRYIFNITEIKGPGFATADEALTSHPTINKIGYDLIVWDETIHEMEVQGKYYFGLDQRDILFEAPSSTEDSNNTFNIKYQTNYLLSTTDPMVLTWKSEVDNPTTESPFTAIWNSSTKGIQLTAKKRNETNTILSDSLIVKAGPFTMKVHVQQKYVNFKYIIDCSSVRVVGTYKPGFALDPTKHQIILDIIAEDASINGTDYVIETEPINGIVFKATGTFNVPGANSKIQGIELKGEGMLDTPLDARTEPFTVKIISNSSSGSYCEATITPVISKMNILSLTSGNYGLSAGTALRQVVDAKTNFGPLDESLVKIEGFDIHVYSTADYVNGVVGQWLTGTGSNGQIADIVLLALGSETPSQASANALATYMRKGGVVIQAHELETSANRIMRTVFNDASISFTRSGSGGYVHGLPGNVIFRRDFATEDDWQAHLYKLQEDPILYGPFGDIRDKQIGEDASATTAIPTNKIINVPGVTIYSYNGRSSPTAGMVNTPIKTEANCFRYQSEDYNIFFLGDAGAFVGDMTNTSSSIYPFKIDATTKFPIPKTQYRLPAYNSALFCNVLAWAVERSYELYPKRNP